MAYTFTDTFQGLPPVTDVNASGGYFQLPRLGLVARAIDPTNGGGEFAFLLGVTAQVSGNLVTYDPSTHQVTLAPASGNANTGNLVAVAMGKTTAANKRGWFCISGVVPIKKDAVQISTGGIAIYQGAAGRITDVAASGEQIMGAQTANTATVTTTTSTVLVRIDRPHYQGQYI